MTDDHEPNSTGTPSPADMLAVSRLQQQRTEQEFSGRPAIMFAAWGLAWLFGFGTLFLAAGGRPPTGPSFVIALLVFFAFLAAAGVVTGVLLRRAARGLRGPTQTSGVLYGWSWTLAFVALGTLLAAAQRAGLSDEVYALLWSAGAGLIVGILFLCGGAMMCDRWQYGVGLWILLINGAGAFASVPGHYLVMSLAGGGGFLVTALVLTLRPSLWTPARPS